MRKISAVGLFCCNKFEETPKQKVIDLSKLIFFYFNGEENVNFVCLTVLQIFSYKKQTLMSISFNFKDNFTSNKLPIFRRPAILKSICTYVMIFW